MAVWLMNKTDQVAARIIPMRGSGTKSRITRLRLEIDAVPDVLPGFGYVDDLTVLAAAVPAVAAHIKEEHVRRAKETVRRWSD